MASFDFSFISMLTKENFENKGALWTEGIISWISITIRYYQFNRVKVVDGYFLPYVGVLSGRSFSRPVAFSSF